MDSKKLLELEPMIKSQYSNINGIVVVRNGYITYEIYYNGYGSDNTHHVSSVTKSIKSFGFEDLLGKNVQGWFKDPNNNSTGGWGLTLTPRDMARFGFLYLNRGIWNNNQIISETWIDESTAMSLNKYGYLWWLREEDGVFLYSC